MNKDIYGYNELESFLRKIIIELEDNNEHDYASNVRRAIKFRVSSGTEFMGESRIALSKILADKPKLSQETLDEVLAVKNNIDKGFENIW